MSGTDFSSVWPIRRTGSVENERAQLNRALGLLIEEVKSLRQELQGIQSPTSASTPTSSAFISGTSDDITPQNIVSSNAPSQGDVLAYDNELSFVWIDNVYVVEE